MTEQIRQLQQALRGRYSIEREIGRGGMAVVYRARDLRHDRDVAIKVLRADIAAALGADRFLQEIRIEARLQHPHILALHDSGQVDGLPYYVMPYISGESLRERLERDEQLQIDEAVRITHEVCDALSYAHEQGVVHRDIKPENILLTSGHAVLADFGIARAISDAGGERLTDSGVVIGTPAYMSPEQGAGSEKIDGRSDLYSLGCVLFEMLAGEPPFTGRTAQAIVARHMQERLPSLEVVRPGIPGNVLMAVEKTLAKVPADRFQTAADFAEALEKPASPTRTGGKWTARVLAGALIIAISLTAWLLVRTQGSGLDPNKVVVFPLVERAVAIPDAGVMTAVLITNALLQADPLRGIDAWHRLSAAQRANIEDVTAEQQRDIAESRRARYYISGVVQGHQDSTTVLLQLTDVEADSLVDQNSATGANDEVALHELGIDALKGLLPAIIDPTREVDLALLRDRDAGAIALWIQGERGYRRSQFSEALDFYHRALAEDSALVLAALKGAQAASWLSEIDDASQLVAVALRNDSLLPSRYRYFARGLSAYLDGRADSAVASFEQALAEDPGWAEAHMALGESFYHLLPSRSHLDSLAEASFAAAWNADTGFTPPVVHLAEIVIRRGDVERGRGLVQALRSVNPESDRIPPLQLMLECVERSAVNWHRVAADQVGVVLEAAKMLSAGARQLACAKEAAGAIMASDSAAEGFRWGALVIAQGLLVAEGHHAAALALLDSALAAGRTNAYSFFVANSWAGAAMEAKASELPELARQWFGEDLAGVGPQSRWELGVWYTHIGDTTRVLELRDGMRAIADSTGDERFDTFANALSAHLSLARADTSQAISQLRMLAPAASRADLQWRVGPSLPVERLVLARILLARGEFEDAHDVAAVFDHPEPVVYLSFLPASLTVRMEAAERMNRAQLAARYRQRLLDLGRTDLIDSRSARPRTRR